MPLPEISFGTYVDPLQEIAAVESDDMESHVAAILAFRSSLSDEQVSRLRHSLLRPGEEPEHTVYGASFDLAAEVEQQILAVRAARDHVMTKDGRLRSGFSSRDAKDLVTAGSTLLQSLMKHHADIMNMERMRALEQTVIETLNEEDPEFRKRVVSRLEERLQA